MKTISSSYSHLDLGKPYGKQRPITENSKIRKSKALHVGTYQELVEKVARISYYNREWNLFYRGQHSDYKSKEDLTSILPTMYRTKDDSLKTNVKEQYTFLLKYSDSLHDYFRKEGGKKFAGRQLILKYPELRWAILQHYQICDTPLIDLTHSLHVACSFAINNNKYQTGVVMLLGMPSIAESISYYTSHEVFSIRLLSFCPPIAKRPFFQEGYVAGPFPIYRLDDYKRKEQFDFSRRLIAKFEIPNNPKEFFGKNFKIIPEDFLLPKDDKFIDELERIKKQ
ncbi:MAG: FRG domain-containing protein [Bacteroidetes bacterium]|nr:FRG domain-containing protein [Bacteroidota bacterium]MBK9524256.1 FRG domain-containing protein [Bacteroidota bacterium]MBK9543674.1 FRG domain-containing protein [Bacteroidota bacterium]